MYRAVVNSHFEGPENIWGSENQTNVGEKRCRKHISTNGALNVEEKIPEHFRTKGVVTIHRHFLPLDL